MSFIVKQEHFEGPLDLLLSLIEKRKLFVNDIALAKVTDDFIGHISTFKSFPIADSANFILIASTLLLIKSKSLLPTLNLTEEEEHGIEDLETRLKIYQEIRQARLGVEVLFGKSILFQPSQARPMTPVFSPDPMMTLARIASAVSDLIRALPKKEVLPKIIVQKIISLEEMIENLTDRVTKNLKMSFREFSKSATGIGVGGVSHEEKVNIIVSFLAMLELVKQGVIHVTQERAGDDIQMETKSTGVPQYI